MSHKSTTKENTKNRAFTPKVVKHALDNLPYNYIVQTIRVIEEKIEAGEADRNYSKNYILEVRKGESFNEEILTALVEVGLENLEKQQRFGFKKKKTPSAR